MGGGWGAGWAEKEAEACTAGPSDSSWVGEEVKGTSREADTWDWPADTDISISGMDLLCSLCHTQSCIIVLKMYLLGPRGQARWMVGVASGAQWVVDAAFGAQ